MADLNRPDYGQVWASTGEKVAPDTVKMQSGWVQEMMPFQYENYLQARQDEAIVYLLQKGVPEYSPAQEYIANKSVVAYQGNLYMATATVTNILPTVTASWKRLNVPLAINGAVPVSSGGTGATTASEARTNLGLGSIATSTAPTTNGIVIKDANDSLIARLITGTSGNITITNPDGVAGNININVGSNVAQLSQDSSWTSKGGIRLPSGSTGERGIEAAGKIRYNTTLQKFEGFDGTSWNALGASSNIEITTLSGNGVTTDFTLNSDVFSAVATDVYIGGIYQNKSSYSVSGSTIAFSEPPVAGVDNIQVLSRRVVDLGLSTATQISIQDTTNLYTSSTVEGALREVAEKIPAASRSLRDFGGNLNGVDNDLEALKKIMALGLYPVFDGPSLIELSTKEEAEQVLPSVNRWTIKDRVVLQLPRVVVNMPKSLNITNTDLNNLNLQGNHTNSGKLGIVSYIGGEAKNHTISATLTSVGTNAKVGDYLMVNPTSATSDSEAFIAGCWKITGISGNTVTFICHNAASAPSSFTATGTADTYIIHTVVQFPVNQAGLRINGGGLGSVSNLVFAGTFNPATDAPFDGPGDGIQVGGSADTYNTSLNESEQLYLGVTWMQRVGVVSFQGNGVQVLHGALYGSIFHSSSNAWRGIQAAGTGVATVKGSVSSANGASGYETEALGNLNCSNGWSIGNQQQGTYAIGLSFIEGINLRSMYNITHAIDARNGGHIACEGSKVVALSGANAVLCNGGSVLIGTGSTVTGSVVVDELGSVVAKGTSTVTGTITVEDGSIFQRPDGTILRGASDTFKLTQNTSTQLRVAQTSSNDLVFGYSDVNSNSWTNYLIARTNGMLYSPITSASIGRDSNPWAFAFVNRYMFGNTGVMDLTGTGSPEGQVTAPPGSTYRNVSGGTNTSYYVKESGTGNTGWVAK